MPPIRHPTHKLTTNHGEAPHSIMKLPNSIVKASIALCMVGACGLAGTAHAAPADQDADALPTTPSAPGDASTAPEPGADDSVEPKAGAAQPAEEKPLPIRATGILWTSVIFTTGVQSFSFADASAITSAVNPALLADADAPNLTFQVQQTRVGLVVGEGTPYIGQIEVDFIHFDQSSPTTQAFPRLRLAVGEWTPAEGHRLFLGQGWDLFSPVNTPSLNLVGNFFWAGNSGFIRHQLGYEATLGDVKIAVAVGLQGSNAGPTFSNLEQAATPSGAVRLTYALGKNRSVGISGLGSALRFTDATTDERRGAFGANAFTDLAFGPVNLRAEAYVAQNLANMGALTLGAGRIGVDNRDGGGFVSAKATFGMHSLTAIFGGAATFDPTTVVPGYTPVSAAVLAATPNPGAGPGIEWNVSGHAGYGISPLKGLQFVLEPYVYATRHKLAPADDVTFAASRVAVGTQLGTTFSF